MDRNLLIYHMRSAGDSMEALAKALHMHPVTLRKKIAGRTAVFSVPEARMIVERYKLTPEMAHQTFFTDGANQAVKEAS